ADPTVAAQVNTTLPLNLTDGPYGDFWVNTPLPSNWTDANGFLRVIGRYAFSLFGFNVTIENLTNFILLP
ncbi:MAG: hypothetical protein ACFFCS_12280, partial [Candidatus Hodarchaeota archaeon]